jgi:hypothetical protein
VKIEKHITLLFFLIMLLMACGGHQYESKLIAADSLAETAPDSAMSILDEINPLLPNSGHDRMLYNLLHTKAEIKAGLPVKSDSMMKVVAEYFNNHGANNERLLANYEMACVYFRLNNAIKAVECLNEAIDKADTASAECDFKLLGHIYNLAGYIYGRQCDPRNSLIHLSKAYVYAMKSKDTLLAINSVEQRIDAYIWQDNPDSAQAISRCVSNMYKALGYPQEAATALCTALYINAEHGDIHQLKSDLDFYSNNKMLAKKDAANTENDEERFDIYYYSKGFYYYRTGRMDSAETYFRKSIAACSGISNLRILYGGMCLLYKKLGQKDSVIKYSDLRNAMTDSVYASMSTSSLQRIQALYDYSHNQKIAEQKTKEAQTTKDTLYIVLILIALLSFATYYFVSRMKREKERQILKLNNELIDKLNELDSLYNDKETFMSLLEEKQSQLDAFRDSHLSDEQIQKMNEEFESMKDDNDSLRLSIHKKEQEIDDLKQKISNNSKLKTQEKKRKIIDELSKSDIVNKLNAMSVKGEPASDEDLSELVSLFRVEAPYFFTEIQEKCKIMTQRELRVCVLVKLNFDTSSIANLLGTSMPVISNTKRTLLSKIFHINGGAKLFDYNLKTMNL